MIKNWKLHRFYHCCTVSSICYLICVHRLELILFAKNLYIVLSHTNYTHFESMFASIGPAFIRLLHVFIDYIVIRFNHGDRRLNYKFTYCYCLSFFHSLIMHLSIASFELVFFQIIQSIKQYFYNLNANFDGYMSENDIRYQSYEHMQCVAIDCIY